MQNLNKTMNSKWLHPAWAPIISITALTVASVGVWWKRKYVEQDAPGYGRKSADQAGLLEDDRAFRGIFDSKKMADLAAPILPAKQPDHPSQEKEPEKIHKTSPPMSSSGSKTGPPTILP